MRETWLDEDEVMERRGAALERAMTWACVALLVLIAACVVGLWIVGIAN
jgi:hypothetical protein